MKQFLPLLATLVLTGCGPMVGVSRSVSVKDYPDSMCVQQAIEGISGVSSVTYRRLTGDALEDAQYPDENLVQIHEYAYVYKGFENSFQFADLDNGDQRYRHLFRSDRTNAPLSDSDVLVDFMDDVEQALELSCGMDLENSGSTNVCVRLFGGCPKS